MIRRVLLLILVAGLFPCAVEAQAVQAVVETVAVEAAPSAFAVVDETESARTNWTESYIEARGQAVPPAGKEKLAQGKLLARRGALVDLQRNLLEYLQGVRVDAKTTMKDFMATDIVRTEVQGMVQGVEILEATWDGEVYTVVGRIRLEQLRRALEPALPEKPHPRPLPSPPAPAKKGSASYTGLVVDARDLPLIPAMTFRIVDESGKEVYGLASVDKERFLSSGLCDYHSSLDYAKGAPRVSDGPLVVKALRVEGPENVDIVVSNKDGARIRGSAYDFRVPCRVSVVKR
ncbi:hypothetical protein KAR29_13135 [Aminithiophilus ramosus]|uniref:DUF5666 domain-containing protein n=2 Tax=Synergistales TaxID=649776 RepID=A0A9Q7EYP2_9BACT|nr:hypothetical protein [Aminithiophilus ramosus]QTX32231.1 hypothetical protein KAR29_13135 [Aminithiophilus ramosus]QVL36099.1 hypothetical protein KIH16_13335 [Synergistota bacterium]